MKYYLVGGAVRDELLGLTVRERDWCVVGATPEELAGRGFRQVGKDFPVYLHPETGEEYALARTERKTTPGYHGFAFDTSASVTIEEDLRRRDFTINAVARDETGRLIDPFGGKADIDKRLIRHVSDAFAEDPVRILRAARFAARFAGLGFRIAPETRDMMRHMVAAGEADVLVAERVWKETENALAGEQPWLYFEALRSCGALRVVFPEIDALFGVPQPAKWHPEIDTGMHTMLVLQAASRLSSDVEVRFAAIAHDLGKATTQTEDLPSHPGHERRGAVIIESMAERLRVPRRFRDLALLAAEFHTLCHRARELRVETLVKLLEKTDAFRRPGRFEQFLLACEADARGRTGHESRPYEQAAFLRKVLQAAASVDAAAISSGQDGADISAAMRSARASAVREFLAVN